MDELVAQIERAKNGDLAAYGEIVRRFQDMAYGCAYAVLSDFHLAEDAAQDAFIEAYRKLSDLREPKAFPGWFRRIVLGQCNRITRKRTVPTLPLDEAAEVSAEADSPDREVQKMEMKDKVLEAIQSLPDGQRMATTLFYINGYSQNEVADFLEVPVSTVKKRLHDSRRKLKESMMNMVEQTLKDSAPTEEFEKKLLQRMQAFGPWGKWVDEGKERVAIFKGGPWTSLASPQTWPGDAVVAEFDARGELESKWGMGWESYFSPYKDMTEAKAMDYIPPVYAVRCGFRERYVWSNIHYNDLVRSTWSRTIAVQAEWGEFNGKPRKWYHNKVERIGNMLRMWIDGVPIEERFDPRPVPKEVYFWLFSICSNCRFKNLRVYRPGADYIAAYAKPLRTFKPFSQRQAILARYVPTITREAISNFGGGDASNGFVEVNDHKLGVGLRTCDEHPGVCSRTNIVQGQEGVRLALAHPEQWNTDNDIFLNVECLDNSAGAVAAFYSSWFDKDSPTEDWTLTDSGTWRNAQYFLRDARFRALTGKEDHHLWVLMIRGCGKDLHLRSVKLMEKKYPAEAHEEVLTVFRKEASEREGEWTVPHYLFHQALVLRRNLNHAEEADRIMREVTERWPDTECTEMYKRMIAR